MTFHHSAFHSHALRTEFHCQWNYVDERYQYMDYKRDIDRNDCIDLFYHLSYIEKFHPFSLHFRQDGKYCDNALDGAYLDGDSCEVFCQRTQTDFD